MTDYTVDEINEAVRNVDDFWYELDYRPRGLSLRGETVVPKVVEADTGGEGHGESCHYVFQVGDQLFRKDGYYASHYGTDWDGSLYEVQAVERTATLYEKKP